MTNSGYKLLPSDNGHQTLQSAGYSKKLIDNLLQTDIGQDAIMFQFKNLIESTHTEPTRVREVFKILSQLIYITHHLLSTQGMFNEELMKVKNAASKTIEIMVK